MVTEGRGGRRERCGGMESNIVRRERGLGGKGEEGEEEEEEEGRGGEGRMMKRTGDRQWCGGDT